MDDLFIRYKSFEDVETLNFIIQQLQTLLGIPFSTSLSLSKVDLNQYSEFLQQQVQITYDLRELEMESIQVGLLREISIEAVEGRIQDDQKGMLKAELFQNHRKP